MYKCIFTLALFCIFFVANSDFSSAETVNGCGFAIDFPCAPKREVHHVQSANGEIPIERYTCGDENSLYWAEMMCSPGIFSSALSDEYISQSVLRALTTFGLSNLTYSRVPFSGGKAIEATGYKTISGKPSTYVVRMFMTKNGYADYRVATASANHPPKGMKSFFDSARLNINAQ